MAESAPALPLGSYISVFFSGNQEALSLRSPWFFVTVQEVIPMPAHPTLQTGPRGLLRSFKSGPVQEYSSSSVGLSSASFQEDLPVGVVLC